MSTSGPGRVTVPALATPSLLRWGAATGVGLVGVSVWAVVTQPPDVWGPGLPLMVLLVLFLVSLVWVRRYVDVEDGVVTQVRARVLRRRVLLGPRSHVTVVSNGGGGVVLGLRGPGGRRRLHLPLLTADAYGDRSQPAPVLRALADALDRHDVPGGAQVAPALRAQADAVDAGVPVRETPLAAVLTHGVIRAASAGGALGAGGSLLS